MEAEASVLGFAAVKEYSLHLWAREADCDATANWVLRCIIDLNVFRSAARCDVLDHAGAAYQDSWGG